MNPDDEEVVADLHMHTTASDGTVDVVERLRQARDCSLETIAVTDHDVIAAEITSRRTTREGIELVAGVEVRADFEGTKVELLGYFVDPSDETLSALLERARGFRTERNRELVDRLAAVTGLDLSYDELDASVPGGLGRPHLASVLVEEGVVDSIGDAFDTYLGEDGSCFVPMDRHPSSDVVDAIQGAGGVVSLAHPGRVATSAAHVETIVDRLTAEGLDALEVAYPYGAETSPRYADIGVADARRLADDHGLLATGGSDCHGPGSGKFRICEVGLTREQYGTIRARADERRALS